MQNTGLPPPPILTPPFGINLAPPKKVEMIILCHIKVHSGLVCGVQCTGETCGVLQAVIPLGESQECDFLFLSIFSGT